MLYNLYFNLKYAENRLAICLPIPVSALWLKLISSDTCSTYSIFTAGYLVYGILMGAQWNVIGIMKRSHDMDTGLTSIR